MSGDAAPLVSQSPQWGRRWPLFLRILALAIWVAALDLWLARHFRSGVTFQQLLTLVGVPAVSVMAGGVLGYLLDDDEQKTLKARVRRLIRAHLSVPVLILLYVAAGLFGLFRSTLTVVSSDDPEPRDVTVAWALEPQAALQSRKVQPGEALDLGLWINPFSSEYQVNVEGYLPKTVRLLPYTGATMVPARDLVRLPTVLLRPSYFASTLLRHGGGIVLNRLEADGGLAELGKSAGVGAWFAGPARTQPAELAQDWYFESVAAGMHQSTFATLRRQWRNPKPLNPPAVVVPGERICILATNVDGKVLAGAVTTIGTAEYLDLFIERIEEDGNEADSSLDNVAACACLAAGRC